MDQLDDGLSYQSKTGQRLGEALLDLKYISEAKLLHQLALEFETKFVPSEKLRSLVIPESLLERFPLDLAEKHLIFPILVGEDMKTVGLVFSDSRGTDIVQEVKSSAGFERIQFFVTCESNIRALIDKHYRGKDDAFEDPRMTMNHSTTAEDEQEQEKRRILDFSPKESAPAIDTVLTKLVKLDGSDLHLTSSQPPKIRLHGDIIPLEGYYDVLKSEQIDAWMREVANEHTREMFDETGDADFAYEVEGVARFRMNWFRDLKGVGAVMRTIPTHIPTLEQLKFPPVLKSFCHMPKGLVLVTGPTGSGKSTTMAAMVDHINKNKSLHIITIEDPIEFVHKTNKCLVNQREVHTHTQSFAKALRAALREDPDIVLVGEMRDLETVHIAIETAETGHLVFGTLHTTTAASTVDRVIDQFPTDQQAQIRVMLSESLKGVISQCLCKRKDVAGRVAVLEILVVNNAVANLIREGKTFQIASSMQTGRELGMQTQTSHMLEMVKSDAITPGEALSKSVDQLVLRDTLEKAGFDVPDFF